MQKEYLRKKNLRNYMNTRHLKPEDQNIVFISYKHEPDRDIAQTCVKIIYDAGLFHWIDEEQIDPTTSDIRIAGCIEQGLDVASALLGIIGEQTLDSPWVPYETGGARGRQRFNQRFDKKCWYQEGPHPLIAHYIYDNNITTLPAFTKLGAELRCLCQVEQWAAYIAEILQEKSVSAIGMYKIQDKHGIRDLYNKNI